MESTTPSIHDAAQSDHPAQTSVEPSVLEAGPHVEPKPPTFAIKVTDTSLDTTSLTELATFHGRDEADVDVSVLPEIAPSKARLIDLQVTNSPDIPSISRFLQSLLNHHGVTTERAQALDVTFSEWNVSNYRFLSSCFGRSSGVFATDINISLPLMSVIRNDNAASITHLANLWIFELGDDRLLCPPNPATWLS